MTRPKDMTPEQEASWREAHRRRRSSPEHKAKALLRAQKWYAANKQRVLDANKVARATVEGRSHRNALERARLTASPELQARARERQQRWQASDEGRAKNRAKSARFAERRRLDAEFDAHLIALEREAAEAEAC